MSQNERSSGGLIGREKNLETAIRDAERNYSVGRIHDAARDFQTISIIFGGMKDYLSAAKFAAKSGDCWVKCGDPLRAAGLYESSAQYFELLNDRENNILYYKKALVQCILADRMGKNVGKVALARNLRRAAVCQCKIDKNISVSHYYSRAAELFISAAEESVSKGLFDEGFDLYKSAAECYFEIKEYLMEARSWIEALICLNKVFENYFQHCRGEEYKDVVRRELSRFNSVVGALLRDLKLVDRLEGDVLERLMLAIIMSLNSVVSVSNESVVVRQLLEATMRIVKESGSKILEKIVSSFNFSSMPVKEEVSKIIEEAKHSSKSMN
ncbi:MAG: hypothetical protein QXS27_05515 [Candidatus Jordarchaeaceae archaeon]